MAVVMITLIAVRGNMSDIGAVVAVKFEKRIRNQLRQYGLTIWKDYFDYSFSMHNWN